MHDADVGAERDLQSTAEGMAVHCGDHGYLQFLPDPTDLLAEMGDPVTLHRAGAALGGRGFAGDAVTTGHRLERREVETGAE